MNIGQKITDLLESNNMKQKDLAQLVKISPSALSDLLNGKTKKLDIQKAKDISKVLGCTLDYLLDDNCINQTTNDSFTPAEIDHIKKYRILDGHGKKAVDAILDIEYDRADKYYKNQAEQAAAEAARQEKRKDTAAWISPSPRKYPPNVLPIEDIRLDDSDEDRITLPVYDAGASAGTGVFLDSSTYEVVSMPDDWTTSRANFGVWVEGDSMEPRFSNGDLVLVRTQPTVEIGDIGIFVLNGEGYIKKLGKNKLVSINPAYDDIEINEWDVVYCKGKVLGKA